MALTTTHLALAHGDITHRIIGAFYDVYNTLGYGFLESVYAGAMRVAMSDRGLAFEKEVVFPVRYRGRIVGQYRADLLVERRVIVELKAAERLSPSFDGQLINYLRASNTSVGLILNFGPSPKARRLMWTGAPFESDGTDFHG